MTFRPYKPRAAGSAHEATSHFIDLCGGARAVSDFIGRSPSTVNGWTDPDGRDGAAGIGFSHACMLTQHFGNSVLAEHLALRAGGLFVPGIGASGEPLPQLTGELAEGMGRTIRTVMTALDAGGESGAAISTEEARRILSELELVARVVGEMRSVVAQVLAPAGAQVAS